MIIFILTIFIGKQIGLHILLLNMLFMATAHGQIMMLFQMIYSPSCRQIGGGLYIRGIDSSCNEASSIFYSFAAYLLNGHYFEAKFWPLTCCILSFSIARSMACCLILLWSSDSSQLASEFVGHGLPVSSKSATLLPVSWNSGTRTTSFSVLWVFCLSAFVATCAASG